MLRICKVVFYPVAGVLQLVLVPCKILGAVLCVALLLVAALNLSRLLAER